MPHVSTKVGIHYVLQEEISIVMWDVVEVASGRRPVRATEWCSVKQRKVPNQKFM